MSFSGVASPVAAGPATFFDWLPLELIEELRKYARTMACVWTGWTDSVSVWIEVDDKLTIMQIAKRLNEVHVFWTRFFISNPPEDNP